MVENLFMLFYVTTIIKILLFGLALGLVLRD